MNKFSHWQHRPEIASVISRRGFLIGATGAGITFGFLSLSYADDEPGQVAAEGRFEPTIWYDIDEDGVVTVNIAEAEMGQHVGTALARIVADELEANWNDVRLHYVDSDPKWGLMVTGGSWSVWQNFIPLSRAGAAGRIALIQAGAQQLGVDPSDCHARDGAVYAGTKSVSYGDIVRGGGLSRTWSADELEAIPLKSADQRRLVGQAASALDVPSKTNGAAIYGIDAKIDGMVFARPLIPPTRYGSEVNTIDDTAAREIPGYLRSIALQDPSGTVPGWVVVLAETYPAAIRAADRIIVDWTPGKTSAVTEDDILEVGRQQVSSQNGGAMVVNDAGVDDAFAVASNVLEAVYTTSTVLHFQLEPVNAVAYQADNGRWEIHTGNQWQSLILPVLATALDVPENNIVMRSYLIGGGFGRRLNGDYAVPAALAAKAAGRPVKLVWTREDDARFDSVRSPSVQRMRMAFNSDGEVSSMQHHASAGWPTQVMVPGFMPPGLNGEVYDPFAIQGADNWYSLGPQRLRTLS
ncbi:MAG: molybdopterin-dependent oxidoreductase, partial [Woeseiaceae bacterium]|nr:molybdopterin-dependent oxidoreductase [Woeseiaceae bacterium]